MDSYFNKQLELYRKKHSPEVLFVHADKTLYTNNETLWFSAYLVRSTERTIKLHTVLTVALYLENVQEPLLKSNYVIGHGISFGGLTLPDSISSGNYQLVASTNRIDNNGVPTAIFTQHISIRNLTMGNKPDPKQIVSIQRSHSDTALRNTLSINAGTTNVGAPKGVTPNALNGDLQVQIKNAAVVKDTLLLNLMSLVPAKIQVFIHNYHQGFANFETQADHQTRRFKIALPDMPAGLGTVTILDSAGKLITERNFFAHHDQQLRADIITDKQTYQPNEPVKIKLKLKDHLGRPAVGVVSFAVVQQNRLEATKTQDIYSYVYLKHPLGKVSADGLWRDYVDSTDLHNLLSKSVNRKDSWQELMKVSSADTIISRSLTSVPGRITYRSKPLKKPVTMSVIRDAAISLIEVNPGGNFDLDAEHLITSEGRKVVLFVNASDKYNYKINYEHHFDKAAKLASRNLFWPVYDTKVPDTAISAEELRAMKFKTGIQLNEVKIKASLDNSMHGRQGSNQCGDYVCLYNILNCRNHIGDAGNTQPVKGRTYKSDPAVLGSPYKGCVLESENSTLTKIEGIYLPREFYGAGEDPDAVGNPEYLSTLFWNAGTVTSKDGESEFSFNTSNLKGTYKIIVQGISEKGLISGTGRLRVSEKE